MKVTKRHIKRIIREEYNKLMREQRIVKEGLYPETLSEMEAYIDEVLSAADASMSAHDMSEPSYFDYGGRLNPVTDPGEMRRALNHEFPYADAKEMAGAMRYYASHPLVMSEGYSRKKLVRESYFKNLLVEIEDYLIYLADAQAGIVPVERAVKLLKREFQHFSRMSDASVLAELMDMQDMFSEIRIDGNNIISY